MEKKFIINISDLPLLPPELRRSLKCSHTRNIESTVVTCIEGQDQKPIYRTFVTKCHECGGILMPRSSTEEEIQRYETHLKQPVGERLAG